jgi:hypothetical protein
MAIWPSQSAAGMNQFYGNPDADHSFTPDSRWEAANIIKIVPPYALRYPVDDKNFIPVKSIRVHKKCADSLSRILTRIGTEIPADKIKYHELDVYGGCYNFRAMRGSSRLSIHSWGAAIDLSHRINGWKKKYRPGTNMMPMEVVKIFEAEGWVWGGLWRTADGMHFQAALV